MDETTRKLIEQHDGNVINMDVSEDEKEGLNLNASIRAARQSQKFGDDPQGANNNKVGVMNYNYSMENTLE